MTSTPSRPKEPIHLAPASALCTEERASFLRPCNWPENASKPPGQIAIELADQGIVLASQSTFDRILRSAGQQHHRGRAPGRCVPAGLLTAGVLVPFQSPGGPVESARVKVDSRSSVDVLTRGTLEGIPLMLNIVALLLTLMALVSLGNAFLGLFPHVDGLPLPLERRLAG